MPLSLPILAGQLPSQYCFQNWQQTLVDFANAMQAVAPGGTFFLNTGPNKPPPELQQFPWLYTDGRIYTFTGVWISPNPETSADARRLFMGAAESDIWSYDGGSGDSPSVVTPGNYSGAMWEKDSLFTGRSPMGPGAVPVTTNPAVTLAPPGSTGDSIGEGQHTQLTAEVGTHVHPPLTTNDGNTFLGQQNTGVSSTTIAGVGTFPRDATTGLNTGGQPMNIIHPVQSCWIIKRTNRVSYLIP